MKTVVNRGRYCRNINREGDSRLSSDIRNYFGKTNNSQHSTDNLQYEDVVLLKDEDGCEKINYPIHIDRGFNLFSLDSYEEYLDLAQDELRDITSTFWGIYKGDLM